LVLVPDVPGKGAVGMALLVLVPDVPGKGAVGMAKAAVLRVRVRARMLDFIRFFMADMLQIVG